MNYDEWKMNFWEETYPSFPLQHGKVFWKQGKDDVIFVAWGEKTFVISLSWLYQHYPTNTRKNMTHWIHQNVSPLDQELEEGLYSYNPHHKQVYAHIQRDEGVYYKSIVDSIPHTATHLDLSSYITLVVEGSLLVVESHNESLPATIALTNPQWLGKAINHYFDLTQELTFFIPDEEHVSRFFIGTATALSRLAEDYPIGKADLISWKDAEKFVHERSTP